MLRPPFAAAFFFALAMLLRAPLLSADGCIGALTAEIREQGEESETTRALSLILASQLAGVLASAAENQETTSAEVHTVSSDAHTAAG